MLKWSHKRAVKDPVLKRILMKKILVIDDSEFDRRMITSAIKSVCDEVDCVELSGGSFAMETIKSESPELTIIDIRMPGMSGWDVLKEIRADKSLRDLKVVMMSGSRAKEDRWKASRRGAHGYYTKPHKQSDYGVVATDMKNTYLDAAA